MDSCLPSSSYTKQETVRLGVLPGPPVGFIVGSLRLTSNLVVNPRLKKVNTISIVSTVKVESLVCKRHDRLVLTTKIKSFYFVRLPGL